MGPITRRVTVVTVTYNAEALIEQTIQSVLNQDHCDMEYIIIDGGSTDGTVDIIKKYAPEISYWCSERDEGIYDAMNKGIQKASGDLINFMNSGDTFCTPDTVSRMIAPYTPDIDVIYGDRVLIDGDIRRYEKAKALESFYEQMPFGHQSAFIKTSVMKRFPYSTEYRLSSDYDFFLKLYHSGCRFKYVDLPVCNFLLGGLSGSDHFTSNFEAMKIIDTYTDGTEMVENSIFMRSMSHHYCAQGTPECKSMLLRVYGSLFNRYYQNIDRLKNLPYRYVIYGHGTIGKTIYEILEEQVEAFIDLGCGNVDDVIVKGATYHPKNLGKIDYDKIIISVWGNEEEIIAYLTKELHVDEEKIIVLELQ